MTSNATTTGACWFPVAKTGSNVAINLSEFQAYIDPTLTKEILLSVIEEHESIRIDEYWASHLLKPAASGTYITALKTVKNTCNPFEVFSTRLATAYGKNLKGTKLMRELKSLPLAEQIKLIESLKPTNRIGLSSVLKIPEVVLAPDFIKILEDQGGVHAFINYLIETSARNGAAGETTPEFHVPRYLELLTILWSRNLVLFPQSVYNWISRSKWAPLKKPSYSLLKYPFIEEVLNAIHHAKGNFLSHSFTFLMTSQVHSSNDLTPELITAFEDSIKDSLRQSDLQKKVIQTQSSMAARAAQTLRLLYNQANPDTQIDKTRSPKNYRSKGASRSDGKFEWIRQANPALSRWSDYLGEYVAQLKTARIDGQVNRLNHFGDYLLALKNPPTAPEFVQRRIHINDAAKIQPNTFWAYIDQLRINPASASSIISQIRYFFDWYIDSSHTKENGEIKNLKNPVHQTDNFGSRRNHSQTKRNALPSYVLNELKDILIADDFAFSKAMKWHYVRVFDKETGQPDLVWFPAINNCLYMMLEMPVRSHQARWLDSGELDEEIFDEKLGVMVKNQSPYRILGRKECALRLHHDGLRQKDWLGLWINTNKTASYDGRDIGYSIPYASDKLAELLRHSIRWANRYVPPMSRPIAYYGDKQSTADRERMSEKGPQVTPLFRDPSLFDPNTPISYRRLSIYYTFVLQEAQTRIQKKHGHNLKLVETNENGKLAWLVDLHTLRVSGITSMIESGVPLEIVSMFVAGHQTLVMTLHYLRYSPLKIRELMSEAHEKSLSNMDMVGSEMFMEDFEHFSQFLLGKDGQGQGSGCDAIRLKTGIMTIGVDGICPGTSCSDGGPVDSTRVMHGPVPGGQRCGLCRHWLTGPGFLLGQVASVNNLAYGIRKKGLELAKLNDDRLTYEDEGNQRKARELRDRADLLNRELAIDIEEWVARYQYAEQSLVLLDEYVESVEQRTGKGKQVALLSSSSAAELKVTLEESHEFALLDQITQMAEFVTGFPNREAELEKHSILSRMLVSNGMDPFLLRLNDAQAREASNLMSALLLQQVESQHLNDVLSGNKKLSAYPNLMAVIGALESNGDARSHRVAEAVNRQNLIECVEI